MLTVNALHGHFEEFGVSLRKDRLMSASQRRSASIRVRRCLRWFSIQERFSEFGLGHTELYSRVRANMWPHKYPTSSLQVRNLIRSPEGERTRAKILQNRGLKDRTNLAKEYVQPALAAGLIKMTVPDKPRSSKQK